MRRYNLISGASFSSTQNSSDLYYESLVEKTILKVAKWTRDTPSVDLFFRPIDSILDAFLTRQKVQQDSDFVKQRPLIFRRDHRRMYPLPVQQGFKYPVRMTERTLKSRAGTVYYMPDKLNVGVRRKRKEQRLRAITAAWCVQVRMRVCVHACVCEIIAGSRKKTDEFALKVALLLGRARVFVRA